MIAFSRVRGTGSGWVRGAISLAVFEFWLISYPMDGFLATGPAPRPLLYFLVPHTISLFLIASFFKFDAFDKVSRPAIVFSALLTIIAPAALLPVRLLLPLTGFVSGFLTIRASAMLKSSQAPATSAGVGLAVGNSLVFLLEKLPVIDPFKFLAISLCILPVSCFALKREEDENAGEDNLYAPFLYIFYLAGGLMYGAIAPRYFQVPWVGGFELFFYIATALACIFFVRKWMNAFFPLGVLLCMLSFAFYGIGNKLSLNLSMYVIQASFALVDFYLIMVLSRSERPVRAFGYGLGTVCFAIACGKIIGNYAGSSANYILAAGNLVLTGVIFVFYFAGHKKTAPAQVHPAEPVQSDAAACGLSINSKQKWYEKKLSAQEAAVIAHVLQGKKYKEVALELGISESSVKTYMKRAYEKTGVRDKDGLMALVSGEKPEIAPQS